MHWRMEKRDAFEVFGIERRFGHEETGRVLDFWTACRRNGRYDRLLEAAGEGPSADGCKRLFAVCGCSEPDEDVFGNRRAGRRASVSHKFQKRRGRCSAATRAAIWGRRFRLCSAARTANGCPLPGMTRRPGRIWSCIIPRRTVSILKRFGFRSAKRKKGGRAISCGMLCRFSSAEKAFCGSSLVRWL